MTNGQERLDTYDALARRLAGACRSAQFYSPTHSLVSRALTGLDDAVRAALADRKSITMAIVGDDLVVDDVPLPQTSATLREFLRRVREGGAERLVFEHDVTKDELRMLVYLLVQTDDPLHAMLRDASTDPAAVAARLAEVGIVNIRLGRLQTEQTVEASGPDIATLKELYNDAVRAAEQVWRSASAEGGPDPKPARTMVKSLARAIGENRTALVALTAMKSYDNYTFTHMVNVSILSMAQARSLGVDGPLLREFGLAGLMHDIGKVKTPTEILTKTSSLTDEEFTIMKRHPVDGAQMLRRTPEMPTLVPIVAFEHHLRIDGSGYPAGAVRPTLNLGTMVVSIADVYDAMRSQRTYQQSFPTDRILAVLKRNDGTQFDQHLVRRFVQLMGLYPPGNLVRLTSGEVAVVLRAYPGDPNRPQVRILLNPEGGRLDNPPVVNLWEAADEAAKAITAPVDGATLGIDGLSFL